MNREVITSLAWGIGIVVLALCATFARSRGYIEGEMVDRIVMGAVGLMVAWFGNQMPKRFVPSARARQAQRVAGWSMALSGLVYAGFWIAAPKDIAVIGGSAAVLAGIAITAAYCLSLRNKAPTSHA
ncbi:ammonium transporter [Pseudoxanthomonas sp. PXM01]|uniref:ammonium transporter n=1 Tax=Pseudoxanthomonas sp. PXM01 TaxID=2769295 RepID=UPI00177BB376|nr:ammonium transporter [Pseudoxanthomonas sp. PXM01]MBD9467998.1 ammonium transporter [Pseudoxanthomonas sp. PXM01]